MKYLINCKHPKYDPRTMQNDIAIIILQSKVVSKFHINIACLPTSSDSYPKFNSTSYSSGWGTLSEGGLVPDILQNVQLTVYNPKYCRYVTDEKNVNWKSQICAGELKGKTCQNSYLYIILFMFII